MAAGHFSDREFMEWVQLGDGWRLSLELYRIVVSWIIIFICEIIIIIIFQF